uniref:Uncharacterized protein n=1 Tax=Leersia perrieri TaxID=77586 RepID=A0A0D9W2B0_9ORYZ
MTIKTALSQALVFAANVRNHVGAKEGYYGNCVMSELAMPTSGEVANQRLRIIRRAKEQIPLQFKNGSDGMNGGDVGLGVLFGYNAFYVASWQNIGFEAPDFGGGKEAWVMCHVESTAVPSCVVWLPRVVIGCFISKTFDTDVRTLRMQWPPHSARTSSKKKELYFILT